MWSYSREQPERLLLRGLPEGSRFLRQGEKSVLEVSVLDREEATKVRVSKPRGAVEGILEVLEGLFCLWCPANLFWLPFPDQICEAGRLKRII